MIIRFLPLSHFFYWHMQQAEKGCVSANVGHSLAEVLQCRDLTIFWVMCNANHSVIIQGNVRSLEEQSYYVEGSFGGVDISANTVWGNTILLETAVLCTSTIQITWRRIVVVSFWTHLEIYRMPQIDGLPDFGCVLVITTLQGFLIFMSQKGRTILSYGCRTDQNECSEHSVVFFCTSLCPALN